MSKLKMLSIVVIACVIAWVVMARWNVWFGNAPEPRYSTPDVPHHILLTMSQDGESRLLTWQCDTTLQDAKVEYYRNDLTDTTAAVDVLCTSVAVGERYVSQGGSSVFYRAEIPTPTPGKYTYRITHPNVHSEWFSFMVNDMTDGIVRFAFLGDIQDSIGGATVEMTRFITERHPDREFYMLGGDLIHRPQERFWNELFRGIAPFATTYPVMAVSGNHEYLKGLDKKSEMRFPLHFAYYLDTYRAESFCFYTMKYDNVELFMLDSNGDIIRLLKQRRALDKALSQSVAKWKILVLHHPPYSIRRKSNNLHLKWLLAPILERNKVDLVLSGHEHGYARIHSHGDLSTPIYTISHSSPKQYTHRNTDVAVYDNTDKYYQLIDCNADTMRMTTYTSRGNMVDELSWIRQGGKTIVK